MYFKGTPDADPKTFFVTMPKYFHKKSCINQTHIVRSLYRNASIKISGTRYIPDRRLTGIVELPEVAVPGGKGEARLLH